MINPPSNTGSYSIEKEKFLQPENQNPQAFPIQYIHNSPAFSQEKSLKCKTWSAQSCTISRKELLDLIHQIMLCQGFIRIGVQKWLNG